MQYYVITSSSLIFENENIQTNISTNISLLISQDLHLFINTTYITPLFNLGMFKISSN